MSCMTTCGREESKIDSAFTGRIEDACSTATPMADKIILLFQVCPSKLDLALPSVELSNPVASSKSPRICDYGGAVRLDSHVGQNKLTRPAERRGSIYSVIFRIPSNLYKIVHKGLYNWCVSRPYEWLEDVAEALPKTLQKRFYY
jgi:hypothetical protein